LMEQPDSIAEAQERGPKCARALNLESHERSYR
jgi:hypothetical protein